MFLKNYPAVCRLSKGDSSAEQKTNNSQANSKCTKKFWQFSHQYIIRVWKAKRYWLILRDQWCKTIVLHHLKKPSTWKIREKLCCKVPYFKEMKNKALNLPKVSSVSLTWTFNNIVNATWRSRWKYIFSLDLKCLPFLDFFLSFETSCQKTSLRESEKFHVKHYLIYVKSKSEFLLALEPKIEMNA